MKINCLIIDDEPIAGKGLAEYVERVDFLQLIGIFDNPVEAFDVANSGTIDLILLDIEMPGLSGIELIRSLKHKPAVIFTTAYSQYAVDGYELDAIDFLVKPIAFHRFLKAVSKVRDHLESRTQSVSPEVDDHFFVKENGKFVKVFYHNIVYAEALQNYVCIHLTDRKILSYITLTMLEEQLPVQLFMKIHKSYIIALSKVTSMGGGIVTIGTKEIPFSRNLKDLLMQRLMEKRLLKR